MIDIQALTKTYNHNGEEITALENVDLHVEAGQIFGIIGKSGAGKSTLIRCINCLERPTKGHVFIENRDISHLSGSALYKARRHMGMIFQHFNLLSSQTAYDNVALPLLIAGAKQDKIKQRVTELLELVELGDKHHAYPSQLSGGQKQRVAIARALANQPKVLLCDEATSALDPQTTRRILKLLNHINERFGLTIVLITHEMDVVKSICDQVAIIDKGKIIEQNNIIELFTHPQMELSKELIHGSLHDDLPVHVRNVITITPTPNAKPIVRIHFSGRPTSQPIIAHLISKFSVAINIMQANMEIIQQQPVGGMLIKLENEVQRLPEIIDYLQHHNLHTEVIGYVPDLDS